MSGLGWSGKGPEIAFDSFVLTEVLVTPEEDPIEDRFTEDATNGPTSPPTALAPSPLRRELWEVGFLFRDDH